MSRRPQTGTGIDEHGVEIPVENPKPNGPDRKPATLTPFRGADLADIPVPDREWHVEGMIPTKQVTILTGDGGAGKSLLAMQLLTSTALGKPWLGRETKAGRALFLTAEDDRNELHRRLCDVARHLDAELADMKRLQLQSLAGKDALLAVPDKHGLMVETPLFHDLDRWMVEHDPEIVALDTAADVFGGNELMRAQVRQFVGMLRGLAIRHDAAVVLTSHPSLTGMATGTGNSGSTAWNNSVRSRLYLQRIKQDGHEPDPDARVLSTVKANYGRTGLEMNLHWRGGVFEADPEQTSLDRMAAGARAERVFLKLLRTFTEQGRYVSASPSSTYAPKVFAEHPDAEDCTKRALTAAMETLLASKRVAVAEHGSGAKARKHLVDCNP